MGVGVSLTGGWLLGLLVVALGVVFGAVVWWWPRWSARTGRALLARIGLLALVNLLVLLTAAVGMNDEFGFFADWTDLTGAVVGSGSESLVTVHVGGDPSRAVGDRAVGAGNALRAGGGGTPGGAGGSGHAGTVQPAVGPSGLGPAGLPPGLPPGVTPGTRRVRFMVTGRLSGIRAMVEVSLPQGYTDPAQRLRRYPVIEAFPGYPGGPFSPARAVGIVVGAHRLVDPVVIAPVAEIPAGRDTECVDGAAGDPQVETWLTRDVPEWAERTLRVRTDRASWATLGWSSGGWCAAMAAMLHPDRYAAAMVLGGYFRPDFGPRFLPFPPNSVQGRRYDLVALAANRPPAVALWVQTSQADRLSFPSSSRFLAVVRAPLSVQSLVLAHAGHRVEVWRPLLPQALAWLGDTVPGFHPAAAGTFPRRRDGT